MKVQMTVEGMQSLYAVAKARGELQALHVWADMAMMWMQGASKEINSLRGDFQNVVECLEILYTQINNYAGENIPEHIAKMASHFSEVMKTAKQKQKEQEE